MKASLFKIFCFEKAKIDNVVPLGKSAKGLPIDKWVSLCL